MPFTITNAKQASQFCNTYKEFFLLLFDDSKLNILSKSKEMELSDNILAMKDEKQQHLSMEELAAIFSEKVVYSTARSSLETPATLIYGPSQLFDVSKNRIRFYNCTVLKDNLKHVKEIFVSALKALTPNDPFLQFENQALLTKFFTNYKIIYGFIKDYAHDLEFYAEIWYAENQLSEVKRFVADTVKMANDLDLCMESVRTSIDQLESDEDYKKFKASISKLLDIQKTNQDNFFDLRKDVLNELDFAVESQIKLVEKIDFVGGVEISINEFKSKIDQQISNVTKKAEEQEINFPLDLITTDDNYRQFYEKSDALLLIIKSNHNDFTKFKELVGIKIKELETLHRAIESLIDEIFSLVNQIDIEQQENININKQMIDDLLTNSKSINDSMNKIIFEISQENLSKIYEFFRLKKYLGLNKDDFSASYYPLDLRDSSQKFSDKLIEMILTANKLLESNTVYIENMERNMELINIIEKEKPSLDENDKKNLWRQIKEAIAKSNQSMLSDTCQSYIKCVVQRTAKFYSEIEKTIFHENNLIVTLFAQPKEIKNEQISDSGITKVAQP